MAKKRRKKHLMTNVVTDVKALAVKGLYNKIILTVSPLLQRFIPAKFTEEVAAAIAYFAVLKWGPTKYENILSPTRVEALSDVVRGLMIEIPGLGTTLKPLADLLQGEEEYGNYVIEGDEDDDFDVIEGEEFEVIEGDAPDFEEEIIMNVNNSSVDGPNFIQDDIVY